MIAHMPVATIHGSPPGQGMSPEQRTPKLLAAPLVASTVEDMASLDVTAASGVLDPLELHATTTTKDGSDNVRLRLMAAYCPLGRARASPVDAVAKKAD